MTGDDGLEDYLARYGAALGEVDAAATAQLWGEPSMMLTDGFVGALATREELAAALAGAQPEYAAQGLARATHTLLERTELSERLLRVHVRWHFWQADGTRIEDADFEYVLRRDDDGLHAYAATLREVPRDP